jgi:valyl-tRNA synthetase
MNNLRYYIAGEQIYQYVWHNLADVILEESKKIFIEGSLEEINSRKYILLKILEDSLKIIHPFIPFITEEIWEMIEKKEQKLLLIESWPI